MRAIASLIVLAACGLMMTACNPNSGNANNNDGSATVANAPSICGSMSRDQRRDFYGGRRKHHGDDRATQDREACSAYPGTVLDCQVNPPACVPVQYTRGY